MSVQTKHNERLMGCEMVLNWKGIGGERERVSGISSKTFGALEETAKYVKSPVSFEYD